MATDSITLRYRDRDTPHGVTKRTVKKLSHLLGMSETQVIHEALAKLARETLPAYQPDEGPLTDETMKAIRKAEPPKRGRIVSSLFGK